MLSRLLCERTQRCRADIVVKQHKAAEQTPVSSLCIAAPFWAVQMYGAILCRRLFGDSQRKEKSQRLTRKTHEIKKKKTAADSSVPRKQKQNKTLTRQTRNNNKNRRGRLAKPTKSNRIKVDSQNARERKEKDQRG